MRIKGMIIGLMALFVAGAFQSAAQDKKATEVLDAFREKSQAYQTIQVEFTYTMENEKEDIFEEFTGMLFIKGDSYRLSIAGQLIICDGETIWTYLEDAEEIQINAVEDDDESITPSRLFTTYYDDHKSKYAGESLQDGKTIHAIELTPVSVKSYAKLLLEIEKTSLQLVRFVIADKSGTTFTYVITKFATDIPVGDDKFTFNASAFPNAEIIDMR